MLLFIVVNTFILKERTYSKKYFVRLLVYNSITKLKGFAATNLEFVESIHTSLMHPFCTPWKYQ